MCIIYEGLTVCLFPLFSQMLGSPQSLTKMKRSFYAARDLYKYRHSYPVRTRTHTHG